MKIKSLILGSASVAALVLASNASAADIVAHHRHHIAVKPVVAAPFSWNGFYAGAEVGYTKTQLHIGKANSGEQKDIDARFGPEGAIGGIYGGVNVDLGSNIIAGIDADANISSAKVDMDTGEDAVKGYHDGAYYHNIAEGAVRARVGYAIDRFLPYVAGGVSVADIRAIDRAAKDGKAKDGKDLKGYINYGWNVGAGVDYALSNNLILRADYRFNVLPNAKIVDPADDSKSVEIGKGNQFRSNNVRVGIAYKF